MSPRRTIIADDLLRLRDIGLPQPAQFGGESPLAVSPDGRSVALVLNQADPDANAYCRALVVVPLDRRSPPRIVDRGGEQIIAVNPASGLNIPIGYPALVRPRWSPDGRWIAYLRKDRGAVQIWRVRLDGTQAASVTHSEVDVQAFSWTADGARLVYSSVPGTSAFEQQTEREGLGGWLYDARVLPFLSPRPAAPANLPLAYFALDLTSGTIADASAAERAQLVSEGRIADVSRQGRRTWVAPVDGSLFSERRLFATDAGHATMACRSVVCAGTVTGVWWDAAGSEIRFLRREGWNKEQIGLYRWVPGTAEPRRLLSTTDVLLGCVRAAFQLACTLESSNQPRRLVLLDPATGRFKTIFDPNPEFAAIRLGRVERLHWRNDRGLEAWGDLVLPPGYRAGRKLPMVVVQYHSSGFLRGGTGDEYPIQLFAARGFAVLSIDVPRYYVAQPEQVTSYDRREAAGIEGWGQRRSLLSSLVTAVDLVIARGIADPKRVGITGLSDGASTAQFALVNTRLFAAAAISGSGIEPKTVMTYTGVALADIWRRWGYPAATRDDPEFWKPYSLVLNTKTITAPLLIQAADAEYLLNLEGFTALREAGRPVELYVFPGEYHMKSQPAHRRAVYERNLDWFDFWLQDRRDPAPAKAAQYRRWEALRMAR